MTTTPSETERHGLDPQSTWIAGISAHVGICVPDMDEAKRFYCDLLGFEVAWEAAGGGRALEDLTHIAGLYEHCVQLTVPGGCRIELQAYKPLADGEAAINRQGLNHLSFAVKDVWAEYERLKALGVVFRCEPKTAPTGTGHAVDGYTFVYFDDPWGLTLELMGPPPGQGDDERAA
jgi:catechol 2,3-dioxygenase-like lactoylglutathione lyase family enzyme